jgi:hypothetical protein
MLAPELGAIRPLSCGVGIPRGHKVPLETSDDNAKQSSRPDLHPHRRRTNAHIAGCFDSNNSRRVALRLVINLSREGPGPRRGFFLMTKMDDDRAAPSCPNCLMPMTLVQVDPRVASFAELHTFCCFGCGDVRAIEQEKSSSVRAAVWPRPSLFD